VELEREYLRKTLRTHRIPEGTDQMNNSDVENKGAVRNVARAEK
jgi:hypothetical protein